MTTYHLNASLFREMGPSKFKVKTTDTKCLNGFNEQWKHICLKIHVIQPNIAELVCYYRINEYSHTYVLFSRFYVEGLPKNNQILVILYRIDLVAINRKKEILKLSCKDQFIWTELPIV